MNIQIKCYVFIIFLVASLLGEEQWLILNETVHVPEGFAVSFHEGMSNSRLYRPDLVINNLGWKLLKQLYDRYVIQDCVYSIEPRIPKIIHQIWLGSPLPEKYREFQEGWIKHHPDWQYKLWTDDDVENLGLVNKKWYDQTDNYGFKSDIARYEILYRFGGVYVDTDYECFRPLDIFHHCFDFYTTSWYGDFYGLNNAIIASVPGNPILRRCIEDMDFDIQHDPNPIRNALKACGPTFLALCFLKEAKNAGRCVAFPINYFSAWPYYERENNRREQVLQWIRPETFALHHWHVSWNGGKITWPGDEGQNKA